LVIAGILSEANLEYEGVEELERYNSNFGLMQVLQSTNDFRRYYLNDFLTQNIYDPSSKRSWRCSPIVARFGGRLYRKNYDVLCIGLGVGIVPMQFANQGARVDVVEINPAVVPLAQRHFDLNPRN
jgi:2-polyprenyl-3-methyl-5-hydroxy-6-metoxy-1,4-benzoquinol methylase